MLAEEAPHSARRIVPLVGTRADLRGTAQEAIVAGGAGGPPARVWSPAARSDRHAFPPRPTSSHQAGWACGPQT